MKMEVPACRACLATDTMLYSLSENTLRKTFENLLGFEVLLSKDLPGELCYVCRERLLTFTLFKDKCVEIQTLLVRHVATTKITKDFLVAIHNAYPCLNLSSTEIEICSYNENNTKSNLNTQTFNILSTDAPIINVPIITKFDPNDNEERYDESIVEHNFELVKIEEENHDYSDKNIQITNIKTEDDDSEKNNLNEENTITTEPIKELTEDKDEVSDIEKDFYEIVEEVKKIGRGEEKVFWKRVKGKNNPKVVKRKLTSYDITRIALTMKKYNMKIKMFTKEEQLQRFLARKDSPEYQNSKLQCEKCYKGFATEWAFKAHGALHTPDEKRRYKCEICDLYFRNTSLHLHLLKHEREITCIQCGEIVISNRVKHHYLNHNDVKYECNLCSTVYSRLTTYKNHMRTRHADTRCNICREMFCGDVGIRQHMNNKHREMAECNTCSIVSNDKKALARHLSKCSQTSRYSFCTLCGDSFDSSDVLSEHFKSHKEEIVYKRIRQQPEYRTTRRVYDEKDCVCDECGKVFQAKFLDFHMRQHKACGASAVSAGSYTCDHCGKTFLAKRGLRQHLDVHGVERRYKCELCPKAFRQHTCLIRHRVLVHDEKKKHKCSICNAEFKYGHGLRAHVLVHTGEKPHACAHCGKAFRLPSALHNHIRIHTGERPYKCSLCPKNFRQFGHLSLHLLVHADKKPHVCDLCDKAFREAWALREHTRTVHMGIPSTRKPRVRRKRSQQAQPDGTG